MVARMDDRLTRARWIRHGLRTLAAEGPGALKAAPLAERLGVSRGSFYWHFRDIGDFRAQLLGSWRERTTAQVIAALEAATDPAGRLRRLMRQALGVRRRLDRAVRAWAAEDAAVAALVAEVDAQRVDYIARLLKETGVAPADVAPRAAFLYWAYLGQALSLDPRQAALAPEAIDALAALLQGSPRPPARFMEAMPDPLLGDAEHHLDPKQAALLRKTLARAHEAGELLDTGQEEVFSRTEVERGAVEHKDEAGKG